MFQMSELQAAMGLAVLPYFKLIRKSRERAVASYSDYMREYDVFIIKIRSATTWNYSYYPVVFTTENELLKALEKLNKSDIFPRRYFYPALNSLPYVCYKPMKIGESVASRTLCLPLYHNIEEKIIEKITQIIKPSERKRNTKSAVTG